MCIFLLAYSQERDKRTGNREALCNCYKTLNAIGKLCLSIFVKVTSIYQFVIIKKKNSNLFYFQAKRLKLHEQLLKSDLTWKKIIKFVDDNLDKKEYQTVNGDLKTILQAAKQIGRFCFSNCLTIVCFFFKLLSACILVYCCSFSSTLTVVLL